MRTSIKMMSMAAVAVFSLGVAAPASADPIPTWTVESASSDCITGYVHVERQTPTQVRLDFAVEAKRDHAWAVHSVVSHDGVVISRPESYYWTSFVTLDVGWNEITSSTKLERDTFRRDCTGAAMTVRVYRAPR